VILKGRFGSKLPSAKEQRRGQLLRGDPCTHRRNRLGAVPFIAARNAPHLAAAGIEQDGERQLPCLAELG